MHPPVMSLNLPMKRGSAFNKRKLSSISSRSSSSTRSLSGKKKHETSGIRLRSSRVNSSNRGREGMLNNTDVVRSSRYIQNKYIKNVA